MSITHKLSDLANRLLPESTTRGLRLRYLAGRRHLSSIERLVYGSFDATALRAHLEERVGTDYQILMVHSSMNRLSSVCSDGPLALVRMLIDFCGPERTLAMPAFYFGDPDVGNVHQTFANNPVFNLRRTPSQMGLATELFRRSKNVIQSRHPVYRVAALGPLAADLTDGHEHCLRPAGVGSPFDFMARHDTMVIGIGKSFHVMTQVHHMEDLMGDEFPVPRTPPNDRYTLVKVIDRDEEVEVRLPTGGGVAWRFNIAKLPTLVPREQLDHWRFHNVPMFAGRAGPVTQTLIRAAQDGHTLYDPP